mgnify:CR=1 FL=1
MQLTKNIAASEVVCKCGCGLLPPQAFIDKIQLIRTLCDFPFVISSGARCVEYNKRINATMAHFYGAIDIKIHGTNAFTLVKTALDNGITGVGIKQHGAFETRFIHLDDIVHNHFPRPMVWSYK